MAQVTFSTSVGGNGQTYTDDNNEATGLGNDYHRARFVPLLAQVVAVAGFVLTKAGEVATSAASAVLSYNNSAIKATEAANSAIAAAASASAAQAYASVAQAVSPDSPMRLNQRKITANFAVGSDYNAVSAGDIEIGEGITVTINQHAAWSIV
jgi:hypothetical protein